MATGVAVAVVGVSLLLAGLTGGYLLFASGDDPSAAAPSTTRDPDAIDPETGLSDREIDEGSDNLLEGELGDDIIDAAEEAAFDEVQATMTFLPGATPQQMARMERAWRYQPLLRGVLFVDAEEMASATGLDVASLSGWGATDDAEAIRTFVCRFADDQGVALVGTGDTPC